MIQGTARPKNGGPFNEDGMQFTQPADGTPIEFVQLTKKRKNKQTTTSFCYMYITHIHM